MKLKIPLTKHYEPSGSGETEMSDITFNEQEKEAVGTTAIAHAMAQFEIPCILFRSSYIGKHVKTTLLEVNLKSKQIQKFKLLLYLEAFVWK